MPPRTALLTLLMVFGQFSDVLANEPTDPANSFWYHERKEALGGGGSNGGVRPSLFTGAAEMDVPIEVPRGVNGVQPSLALRYSSRAGRGSAGVGWSLELPKIVRSQKYGADRAQQSSFAVFELGGEELVQSGPQENGCDRYYSKSERYQTILRCAVTSDANMGTYSYVPYTGDPASGVGHVIADVALYWVFGNTPDDPTPLSARIRGPRGDGSECVCSKE